MTTLSNTLNRLKAQGLDFDSALDIGAHHGEWFKRFSLAFPGARILSIEANPENMPLLKRVNPNSLNLCLGETFCRRRFFLPDTTMTTDNSGASLYKERLHFYENAVSLDLEVITLDSLNLNVDFIKIDIQGAELEVLKGGLKTLEKCSVLQVEMSMVEYNEGSPSPSELISFLYSKNFILDSFFDFVGVSDRLVYCDALFIRADLAHLRSDIKFLSP